MKIVKHYFTESSCYKAGRKINPKGIFVHTTGANNPMLKRYVGPDDGKLGYNKNNNHWNRPGVSTCVHAFIGKLESGEVAVYQTLPWDHRAWHAGRSEANNNYIAFEICEDGLDDPVYFNTAYSLAVDLCVELCRLYPSIKIEDIIGHYEGHQRGIASNHADPKPWFSRHGKSMDSFREDVRKKIGGTNMAVYRRGSKGQGVTKLQQDLIKLGYNVGSTGADGNYGPATQRAVRAFQKDRGISVDGIAGPDTQKHINLALNETKTSGADQKLAEAKKLARQILDL